MSNDIKTITFKSNNHFYYKELSGKKNNTVRETDDWGEEMWSLYENATHVRIHNGFTGDSFIREISDKTTYKNIAVISWEGW